MKFVISYSCGKDSTLSLHKMIAAGHTQVGLLVMVNKDEKTLLVPRCRPRSA